jgi:hypothetical protein
MSGNMKMKTFIYLFIFSASFISSCKDSGVTDPGASRFIPGRVVVLFVDTSDYRFISAFVNSLHLVPQSITADSSFSVKVQIDSGTVPIHMERLENDTAVAWVQEYGFDGQDLKKHYLQVHFKGSVTIEYARALVASIHELRWLELFPPSLRMAVIRVPDGEERAWIEKIRKYPFVTWVGYNGIAYEM